MELTWKHMISCNWTIGGKMPVCVGSDVEVYLACARVAGIRDLSNCKACRVVNTLKVGELWVSPALLEELLGREDIMIHETGLSAFDKYGGLMPFESTHHITELEMVSARLRQQIIEEDARNDTTIAHAQSSSPKPPSIYAGGPPGVLASKISIADPRRLTSAGIPSAALVWHSEDSVL